MPTQPSTHDGHRQRLLAKLENDGLSEHEYLEILLFNALPRKNTNDIAHRLLSRFGTLVGVFEASIPELRKVEGVGESVASYLFCVGKCNQSYYNEKRKKYEGKYVPLRFSAYLLDQYQPQEVETLVVYYVDGKGKITGQDSFLGFIDTTIVDSTELVRLLFEHSPAGIVLVHNHPSGNPKPSVRDVETTKRIQLVCASHNVILLDHVILGDGDAYSYYLSGEMQKISKEFSMDSIVQDETEEAE